MALFLVQHQHTVESCPAADAKTAKRLADYVSQANASRLGVKVLADCVLPGEHTVLLVVEAKSADKVAAFSTLFKEWGPVTIKPVLTCQFVAARGYD